MFPTNTQKFRAIVMLVCIGLLAFGLAARTAPPALAASQAVQKTSSQTYHDDWRKLWEDHIT